ncbi:TetR/AcrR family transcriptional regulator [Tsukamurella sp. DT100]|uniref:TetR/AcrR family transcriptional regulator n=1 Tax=Tsukamurella sp. DT100 TaxID=3393415 RepID=UPI003CF11CE1
MPPDASDTKRRILTAARSEFAQSGFAGARIDRIAEQARANKRSIYVHFGPKEQLFDIVVAGVLSEMAEAVHFTPDDLPGYAAQLHDYLAHAPDTMRLMSWANLERPISTTDEVATYRAKIDALGHRFGGREPEVLALILGLVTSAFHSSPALWAAAQVAPRPPRSTTTRLLRDSVSAVLAAALEA